MPAETGTSSACLVVVDLLAGAALEALSAEEQLQVQGHVARCESCAVELAELREVAAALGQGVPQVEAPPDLKARVLAAALAERSGGRQTARQLMALSGVLRRLSPVWGAAAAAVILSVGSLAWAVSLQSQVAALASQAQLAQAEREKAARYDRIVQVLASQQLETRSLTPAAQSVRASGTIWLDPASRSGMVMVHDLPPLPPGRGWQLWFVRGSQRLSGGMVWVDRSGAGYGLITVPDDLASFQSVGITEEPAGGSPAPTTPRVIGAQL